LDEIPRPDVVIVCCGGGGLLSGVAAGVKLKGSESTRIFGVEPEGGGCYFISPPKYPYLTHFIVTRTDSTVVGVLKSQNF